MIRHHCLVALVGLAVAIHASPARADDEEPTDDDSGSDTEPTDSSSETPVSEPSNSHVPVDTSASSSSSSDSSSSSRESSSEPTIYSNADLDESDGHSWQRGWVGLGYFRTASQTRRGPVVFSDGLVMPVNAAIDLARHGYSLEVTSRGLFDVDAPFSRTFNYVFSTNAGGRHAVDQYYGAPLDGRILRVRYVKYIARGSRWRIGAGFVASDYFHIAGVNIIYVDQAAGSHPPFNESWFVTVGPHVRLDYMMSKTVQMRIGTMVGIPIVDLDDKGGARPYPVTTFVHFRIRKKFYIGIESAIVLGVPDVFTQRHELQLGFIGH